jgi:hypothetical protein
MIHQTCRLALIALAGCGSYGKGPPMTGDLVPPPVARLGLVMGASTEADVARMLPGAKVGRDRSLGGDMTVLLNDVPAIHYDGGVVAAWLIGTPARLVSLNVQEDGVCDWVATNVMSRHPPTFCGPSNRKTEARTLEACLASAGGAALALSCDLDCILVGGRHTQCLSLTLR